MNAPSSFSSAVEDYLERILELMLKKGYARVVDIAASLNISQPSVTSMLRRLDGEGFIHYEKYRGLILTEEGTAVARRVLESHQLLTDFLTLLGIPAEVSEQDIEGMEHCISPETLVAIEVLTCELKKQPAILKKIQVAQKNLKKESSQKCSEGDSNPHGSLH